MGLWHAIGDQLSNPRGLAGQLVGRAMRWANDQPTRLAVDALNPAPGDSILDVGCGPGHGVALLSRLVPEGRVTGIDRSPVMIEQARTLNARAIARDRVALSVQNFHALPFPGQSFDGILASNVIYFWPDPADMISRLRTLLRPGGRLVIYATSAQTMQRWKFARTGTHHWVDRSILEAALREGGFDDGHITIDEVRLPANVDGLVATAMR